MTSSKQYDDTGRRPERASSSPPLVSVFVESTQSETTPPVSTHKRSEPSTCRVKRADVRRERIESTLQLFLFVSADDDAGIFLDSRGVPPSSRSVSSTDDSQPGTSRCTPSDIVNRCLWACGSFRRCPLPSFPVRQELRWTELKRTEHHRTIFISSS